MDFNGFLKNYLHNLALQNRRVTSFYDYLSESGDGDALYGAYEDTLKNARLLYAKEMPTYGTSGEKLGALGLRQSGYAAYLAKMAEEKEKSREKTAGDTLTKGLEDAREAFEKEAKSAEKKAATRRKNVTKNIQSLGYGDMETARAYAIASGLSPDDATLTAALGVKANSEKRKGEILSQVLSYNYSYAAAYNYAIRNGLSSEDACDIAEAADEERKNRSKNYYYFSYR